MEEEAFKGLPYLKRRMDSLRLRWGGARLRLGTSTRNDSKQSCWTVRHEESEFICFLHRLGTSTRNDSNQS